MAETEENNQEAGRTVGIQRVYVKDASFEAPNSPDVFSGTWEPKVTINIKTEHRQIEALGPKHWEVSLHVSVEAVHGDKTALLAEVEQAGIFEFNGFEGEDLQHMLGAYCPTTLYPYAREAIGTLVSKGGFPQLVVQPLNFEAMYQQHVQQAAAKQA